MQLSKKIKFISQFFSIFLKASSIFEHFEKKDDIHSQCISEVRDSQRYDETNVWIASFQSTFRQ